jgi:hypothetical protein
LLIKRNEEPKHIPTWECWKIIINERRQLQNITYCMIPFGWQIIINERRQLQNITYCMIPFGWQIIINERRQLQNITYCMIPFGWHVHQRKFYSQKEDYCLLRLGE